MALNKDKTQADTAGAAKSTKTAFLAVSMPLRDPHTGVYYDTERMIQGKRPASGSWLDCQIQAGLIRVIQIS